MRSGSAVVVAVSTASFWACVNQAELLTTTRGPAAPTMLADTVLVDRLNVVPDPTIGAVLRRELDRDAEVGPEHVGVEVVNGVVTLQGTVSNRLAAQRAVEIAPVVRGVRAIVDRISVAPVPRPDYELDFAVAARLAKDDAVSSQRIGARTHDGVVRLTGDVDSDAARRIALADVLAIPGVGDVVDTLSVRPLAPRERADSTLTAQVKYMLRADPWLDDAHVTVSSKDGLVKLGGWVGNAAERVRAEEDARLAEPSGFDDGSLRVDALTDDGTLRAEPPAVRADRDVMQSLADAYVLDPRVHPFVPGIDARNGVVVLTGVAPNSVAAAAAVADARDVPGVRDVRNDLQTRPSVSESDRVVRTDIQSAIRRDPELLTEHLFIDVAQGRVILSGTVHSEQSRLDAVTLVSTVPGVHAISDQIEVEPRLTPSGAEGMGRAETQPRSK
ncbi:MAG TPA: BON domain-containing protein [Polyangiaceae bacterium]|nr:BON domain-containing protein [Polyangiaceae bacterium]